MYKWELLDQLSGILSDHQLFVGGDDPNLNLGVLSGDLVLAAALCVGLSVDLDTQEAQVPAPVTSMPALFSSCATPTAGMSTSA